MATMPCPGAGTQASAAAAASEMRERKPQSAQSCRRQHERVVLTVVELAQPGVEITPDWREARTGKQHASAAPRGGRCR